MTAAASTDTALIDSDTALRKSGSAGVLDRVAIVPLATLVVLVFASMINPIEPPSSERASGLNPLVLSKLAIAGAACVIGGLGLLMSRRVWKTFGGLPGALLLVLALELIVASAFATGDSATISRASSLIFLGYLAFTISGLSSVGVREMIRAAVVGLTLFLVTTWFLFLAIPSLGVFYEYTTTGDTVTRMGGTNHPNSVAREAVLALMLSMAMLRRGPFREVRSGMRTVLYGVIVLSLATLVVTYSRTSILAGVVAIGVMMFDKIWSRNGATLIALGLTAGLGVILASGILMNSDASDSAVSAVTKSGEVEELTSATGRTIIWAEAIEWISIRPLTGWGLDSAATVMSEGTNATHNLLLHVTFSGGIPAGLILLALLSLTCYRAAASREPLFRGIATYVFLSGLVEDTLIESFPAVLTILWVILLVSPVIESRTE